MSPAVDTASVKKSVRVTLVETQCYKFSGLARRLDYQPSMCLRLCPLLSPCPLLRVQGHPRGAFSVFPGTRTQEPKGSVPPSGLQPASWAPETFLLWQSSPRLSGRHPA